MQKQAMPGKSESSRRTLVKGTAWAVPVITLTNPAPAYAASQDCQASSTFGYSGGGPTIYRSASGDSVDVHYYGNGIPLTMNCPVGSSDQIGYWGWALPSGGVSGNETLTNVDPSHVKIFLAFSTPYPSDYLMDISIDLQGEFSVSPQDALTGSQFPVTAITFVNNGVNSPDTSSPALAAWNMQSGNYPGGTYPIEGTGYYSTLEDGVKQTWTEITGIPGQVRMVIEFTVDLSAFISSSLDSIGFMATPNLSLTRA